MKLANISCTFFPGMPLFLKHALWSALATLISFGLAIVLYDAQSDHSLVASILFSAAIMAAIILGLSARVVFHKPIVASIPPANGLPAVFFPRYDLDDWEHQKSLLLSGRYAIDSRVSSTVGVRPNWHEVPAAASSYFMFNLHTLRFLCPLIRSAELGNAEDLYLAADTINDWNEKNSYLSSPTFAECYRGRRGQQLDQTGICDSWGDEHAVAWRTIVLSYYGLVCEQLEYHPKTLPKHELMTLVARHGCYLSRPSSYRHPHNHGLNNSLALIALGLTYPHLAAARYWLSLGIFRAEQQMRENVSEDGIHLEQSGLYHVYTLRSFLEIALALQSREIQLSKSYASKLQKMKDVAEILGGPSMSIFGLPFSQSTKDKPLEIRDWESFQTSSTAESGSSLFVAEEGGVAIFRADSKLALEAVFHTRILEAGHWQEDALGLTVRRNGREVVCFPSTSRINDSKEWRRFFHSAYAHNTVAVAGLTQKPPTGTAIKACSVLNSFKLGSLAWKLGFVDVLVSLKELFHCSHVPLISKLCSGGGKILHYGSCSTADIVTARSTTYKGVTHTRTVARVHGSCLVVYDFLQSSRPQHYQQLFHFLPGLRAEFTDSDNGHGHVMDGSDTIAVFYQFGTDVSGTILNGQETPTRRAWYSDHPNEHPSPIDCLTYTADARRGSFVWVLLFEPGNVEITYRPRELNGTELIVRQSTSAEVVLAFHDGVTSLQS